MEVILCLSLAYYYLAHAFLFWRSRVFGFKIVYLAQLAFLIIPFGLLVFWRYRKSISVFEYSIIAVLIVYSYLSSKWHFDMDWYRDELQWAVMGVGIGVFMSREEIPSWVFWLPILVISSTILYNYVVLEQTTPVQVFSMNRNRFSMIITGIGFLGLMNYALQKRLGTIPALCMALVIQFLSYYSQSRAVLLVASILTVFVGGLLCFNIYKQMRRTSPKNNIKHKLFFVVTGIISFGLLGLIISLIGRSRLGSTGFADVARMEMYKGFFRELTWKNFLTGFDTALVTPSHEHVHNSFLQAIVDGGVVSLYFFAQFILASWYYFKQRSPLIVFLGLLFVYAFADHIFYVRFTDIVLFPLIINAFYVERMTKEKETL